MRIMPKISPLWALAVYKPGKAKEKIIAAFVAAKGVGIHAADDLKVTYNGLNKIIRKLDIGDDIDAACESKGFPRHRGRPRGEFRPSTHVTMRKHGPKSGQAG